jgi:hypothetical protein
LCKECAQLGKDELAYRQTIRNLERLVTWEGIIPRKKREQFRKYLGHKDERVRARAQEIEAADATACNEQRFDCSSDELQSERADEDIVVEADSSSETICEEGNEMPF